MTDQTDTSPAEWIAAGRALADAATPGPWRLHPLAGDCVIADLQGYGAVTIVDHWPGATFDDYPHEGDAPFIAEARTRLPAALAALEAVLRLAAKFDGLPEGRGYNAALDDVRTAITATLTGGEA